MIKQILKDDMQEGQFLCGNCGNASMALAAGKARGSGRGCAELLWQENLGSLMVISLSFHKVLDLVLYWLHQDLNGTSIVL